MIARLANPDASASGCLRGRVLANGRCRWLEAHIEEVMKPERHSTNAAARTRRKLRPAIAKAGT